MNIKFNEYINLKDIIDKTRILSLRSIDEFPDLDSGGGGGTGGGGSGTTSANIVPSLSISPSADQSILIGSTLCFTASGAASFPLESERIAVLDGGCSATTSGTWTKNCGVSGEYTTSQAFDTQLIYKYRPFQFTGRNSSLNSPALPVVNVKLVMGVKSTTGYSFFWELSKECANINSGCNNTWVASIKMIDPNGTETTFLTTYVGFNELFRIRSDGNIITWDNTTEGSFMLNRYFTTIPSDSGNFQFFTNALYTNNRWTDLKTFKGSYQKAANSNDYVWSSTCGNNLVVNGDRACYTPTIPTYCKICVTILDLEPRCASVVSAPLSINPVGIPCKSCNDDGNCENIPTPTTPVITAMTIENNRIKVLWQDSISFTQGLNYEIDVNGNIETSLGNDAILNLLPPGVYNIRVRAIDYCGISAWSNSQQITLT